MKKYIIGLFAILIAIPAFAHSDDGKSGAPIISVPTFPQGDSIKWPTECVLDHGKYNQKGEWVNNDGTVHSQGFLEDAIECLSRGSLPKSVFFRVGIWGTEETTAMISDKHDHQLHIMMEKARPAVEKESPVNDNN